ncbi:MAG: hypothetical protein ACRDGS_01170 [Chloroflexota bacterium]
MMSTYAQSTTNGRTGGVVGAALALLTGALFCFSASGGGTTGAIMLTLGPLLLAAGAVGRAGGFLLVPAHPALAWRRGLDRGRWVAGGVVIACAFGSAFDPFFTVMLLVAAVLFVGAAARFDRGVRQPILPGAWLLIAGLVASVATLVLAYQG